MRGTRSSCVSFSPVASSKGENFLSLCIAKPRTPNYRYLPKLGPQYQGGSLSSPFEADTWHAIRLPAFSPITVSNRKKQPHHIPIREVARALKTWGPQQRRGSLRPSDLKDTWWPIKPSRHFSHHDFKSRD
jgi:hypothetical protein